MSLDSEVGLHSTTSTASTASITASIAVPTPSDHHLLDRVHASSPALSALASTMTQPTVSPMAPSTSSTAKTKPTTKTQAGMNGGRWTEQEHQSFLAGLRLYGREWKKVASKIKTRTSAQIRSHAQKYFAKLARDEDARKNGLLPPSSSHEHGGYGGSSSASSVYGYYSDGGSSAVNSGDDGGADTDSSSNQRMMHDKPTTNRSKDVPVLPFPSSSSTSSDATNLMSIFANPKLGSMPLGKKRSRSPPSFNTTYTSSSSFKKPKHETFEVDLLPSPEELLEIVPPNIRQRLSCLIDAEICALQVLSCYALLQRHQNQQQPQPPTYHATTTSAVSAFGTKKSNMTMANVMASSSSIY